MDILVIEIMFNPENTVNISQANFLAVSSNKGKLLNYLKLHFAEAGILVKQSESGADYMIAVTAATQAEQSQSNVFVVGQDTDLFVLLIEHCITQNLYFFRPGVAGKMDKITNIHTLKSNVDPAIVKNILFVHAMSDCDTTSAFFKKGRKSALIVLSKNEKLSEDLLQFKGVFSDIATLLKLLFCGCKSVCSKTCTCKKVGI